MYWSYGLVKQNDGKWRVWEITIVEGKNGYVFGHSVPLSWMLAEFRLLVVDLYRQWKAGELFKITEKMLEPGNKKFGKKIKKILKNINNGKA